MSTYAVIETGGKQYRVRAGDIVTVEKLAGEKGSPVQFEQVLWVSSGDANAPKVTIGKPFVNGAKVEAEIVSQGRGEKIMVFKMKRRKQYRKIQGHRQEQTELLITSINGGGQNASLGADEKKSILGKYSSPLRAKGPARSLAQRYLPAEKNESAAPKKTATSTAKKPAAKKKTKA